MKIRIAFATLLCAGVLCACHRGEANRPISGAPQAGGLYSFHDGEGGYRVGKVLAVDDIVFVRHFGDRWPNRPKLSVARKATQSVAVAYSLKTIEDMQPVLLEKANVTPAELQPYEEWKESKGDVF
jgi:hypothetical protein